MILNVQLGMEFHLEEKDGGKILQVAQFHMILVLFHFFLILGLYCPQYVLTIMQKMIFTRV